MGGWWLLRDARGSGEDGVSCPPARPPWSILSAVSSNTGYVVCLTQNECLYLWGEMQRGFYVFEVIYNLSDYIKWYNLLRVFITIDLSCYFKVLRFHALLFKQIRKEERINYTWFDCKKIYKSAYYQFVFIIAINFSQGNYPLSSIQVTKLEDGDHYKNAFEVSGEIILKLTQWWQVIFRYAIPAFWATRGMSLPKSVWPLTL